MRALHGREYKSQTMLFGLPLIHVATGIDPQTGKTRIAKGIIAFGNIAFGVIAFGSVAVGGIAFGGVSLGLLSLGGLSIGALLAIGGCALGGGWSFGGLAVSTVAVGGMAVGYFAIGGGVAGMHTLSGLGVDPEVAKLLSPWTMNGTQWRSMLAIFCPTASLISSIMLLILFLIRTRTPPETPLSYHERKPT